jgi:hypothetical protein
LLCPKNSTRCVVANVSGCFSEVKGNRLGLPPKGVSNVVNAESSLVESDSGGNPNRVGGKASNVKMEEVFNDSDRIRAD